MSAKLAIFAYDLGASFIDRHIEDILPGRTVAVGTYGPPPLSDLFPVSCPVFLLDRWALRLSVRLARRAGVSTKTLYRLIPNKDALFEGMVSDRLDRFVSEVNLHAGDDIDIEEALCAALIACADLALDEEVIELQRMVLQEAGKFSDIAGTFYRNAIQRTVVALADWLRMQQKRGLIELDDVDEAAGMLLGMVSSAPRRAALFGRVPLPSRSQIEARVRSCAAIFLHGCQAKRIRAG